MTAIVIPCKWSGEAFEPLPRFHNIVNASFVVGEIYTLVPTEERSHRSHNHYFAALGEAWQNLPEGIGSQFDSVEHFRARGLIENGFYNQREFVCSSRAEAERLVKFMRNGGGFAVYSMVAATVIERTPKSQSLKAMGRADFQQSKQAVLDWAWSLVGISPETARKNAGRAA